MYALVIDRRGHGRRVGKGPGIEVDFPVRCQCTRGLMLGTDLPDDPRLINDQLEFAGAKPQRPSHFHAERVCVFVLRLRRVFIRSEAVRVGAKPCGPEIMLRLLLSFLFKIVVQLLQPWIVNHLFLLLPDHSFRPLMFQQ